VNHLKQFRKEAGFSYRDFGVMCSISHNAIALLEKEETWPRLKTAYAISNILGKSVYDIWPDQTKTEEVVILRVVID